MREALSTVKRNRHLLEPHGEDGYQAMTEQQRQRRLAERRHGLEEPCK